MAFGHGSFFWVHFKGRIFGAVGEDFRHNAQGCRKLISLHFKVFLLLKLTCSAFDPRQEAHSKIPSYSAKPSVGVFQVIGLIFNQICKWVGPLAKCVFSHPAINSIQPIFLFHSICQFFWHIGFVETKIYPSPNHSYHCGRCTTACCAQIL